MWLENLKELKKKTGMSSKQIAEKTRLPERTVSLLIPEEGDPILLRIREGYGISYEELSTGDLVEVTILNRIMETYPAQSDLFAIRKLSDGSSSDIPADVRAKLDENSWYREED